MVEGQRPIAGELVHEPVGAFNDLGGLVVDGWLVPLEPQGLGEHPLRRHHTRDVAKDGVSGNANLGGFAEGALIRLKCGERCYETYRDLLWREKVALAG